MAQHKIFTRPYSPFPSVFGKIDDAMRKYYDAKYTSDCGLGQYLPYGLVLTEEKKIRSKPIVVGDLAISFSGLTDAMLKIEDGTWGVLDFKCSQPKETQPPYERQLGAYQYILENPEQGSTLEVSLLGLVYVHPVRFGKNGDRYSLDMAVDYVGLPYSREQFKEFLDELIELLQTPFEEVEGKVKCPHCEMQRAITSPHFASTVCSTID
jgi:hypothetical protein